MTDVMFSGVKFQVRKDGDYNPYGPGKNYFQGNNVWVDDDGLHLRISKDKNGNWESAEAVTYNRYGFGGYCVILKKLIQDGKQVPLNQLDRNATIGFFGYPTSDVGPDGTHEFDIEYSYWGADPAVAKNFIQCSNYPSALPPASSVEGGQMWRGMDFNQDFKLPLLSPLLNIIERGSNRMRWQVSDMLTGSRTYLEQGGLSRYQLSQEPMPLHFNLWLNKPAPFAAKTIEVVFDDFRFSPEYFGGWY